MKQFMMSAFVILSFSVIAQAEEIGVNLNKIDTSQDTTISIKKGDSAKTEAKKVWTLSEGEEEITGDEDVLLKKAQKNWKTACKEWKTEFKENNKDNKVVSMNCGKMSCSKEGVESTCSSKATHKIKTLSVE